MSIKEQMKENLRDAYELYDELLKIEGVDPNIAVDCITKLATTMFIQSHRARSIKVPVIKPKRGRKRGTQEEILCVGDGCTYRKPLHGNVIKYSMDLYGRPLCIDCQDKVRGK